MQIMSASGVVAYFGRELSASEYYTAEHGVWSGKGADRLGLPSDLTKEDFVHSRPIGSSVKAEKKWLEWLFSSVTRQRC